MCVEQYGRGGDKPDVVRTAVCETREDTDVIKEG